MPNKKTRLKLKDNVRKGLIAFMSMALLFTTIQFTNVRAEEGQTDPTPVTENTDVEQGQEYELDFVVESEIGLFAKWLEVTLNGEVVELEEDGEGNITSKVTVSEDDLTDGTAELKVDVERYLVEEGEEDVPPYKYYKIDEVKVDDTSLEGNEGVYSVPVDGNKTVTITLGTDMRFQETEAPEETEEPVETEEPEVPVEEAAVYGPNDRTVELGQTIDITGKNGSGHKWSSDNEDVASVNSAATQTMTVRARNVGTAKVTHTYKDKSKTQTETFNVTVTMPSTFDIEIEVGEEKKFTTEQTYESSDTKVAQMKPLAGTVIGVSEGVTTLTQPTYGTKLYTVKVVQPTPIVPVVTADKTKDLVAGDVVTFDIVLENTNAKELKDVVVDVTKPFGAIFVDDSNIQKTVDVPAGDKVTLKAQYSVTAADVAAGKDIEFEVEVTSAGVKKNATAVVKPFDAANAFDVSKAVAEGSKDYNLKEGETVYFYVYVRNNSSTVLTDVVVEELLTGAEIVDDGTGLYVIESGKARIEYIGSGEIVPVKAKYVMTAADVTAKKAISNTAKATYAGVSKESNAVSFRPASVSTVDVYVYMKVGGFSKEALAALGIPDGLVTNGSGYAPVGVLKVDESFFIGQGYPTNWASSMTAMLRNSADWDRLFNSVVSLETKGMVDYSGRKYSKNNGN
ncbi:MAG: Ig-like domain-containing protein, partial [Erysipelotrichaceae bacterium]|nr:Ig-like domain-containing protein [Erysipelotrichaceae bacterium]